jgi:hypothetical protein
VQVVVDTLVYELVSPLHAHLHLFTSILSFTSIHLLPDAGRQLRQYRPGQRHSDLGENQMTVCASCVFLQTHMFACLQYMVPSAHLAHSVILQVLLVDINVKDHVLETHVLLQ